jgi:hypothetical protein
LIWRRAAPAAAAARAAAGAPAPPTLPRGGAALAASRALGAIDAGAGRAEHEAPPSSFAAEGGGAPPSPQAAGHAPRTDLLALADQVARILMRQFAIERERRGAWKW